MDALDPRDAQRIVGTYLELVERHTSEEVYPGTLRDLPYSKETIRTAFRTALQTLIASDQLTSDLRDYLEIGYVSLADYVEEEFATLLREYVRSGEELATESPLARERVATDAWRRMKEQGRLAGEIARSISIETEHLRAEFRSWQAPTVEAGVSRPDHDPAA